MDRPRRLAAAKLSNALVLGLPLPAKAGMAQMTEKFLDGQPGVCGPGGRKGK